MNEETSHQEWIEPEDQIITAEKFLIMTFGHKETYTRIETCLAMLDYAKLAITRLEKLINK